MTREVKRHVCGIRGAFSRRRGKKYTSIYLKLFPLKVRLLWHFFSLFGRRVSLSVQYGTLFSCLAAPLDRYQNSKQRRFSLGKTLGIFGRTRKLVGEWCFSLLKHLVVVGILHI